MDDIFVYCVDLPKGIHEMVTPCHEGYTVYVDIKLDLLRRRKAFGHALRHIIRRDFEKGDVQKIERDAHGYR